MVNFGVRSLYIFATLAVCMHLLSTCRFRCGHCTKLKPTWVELANQDKSSDISIVTVNVLVNTRSSDQVVNIIVCWHQQHHQLIMNAAVSSPWTEFTSYLRCYHRWIVQLKRSYAQMRASKVIPRKPHCTFLKHSVVLAYCLMQLIFDRLLLYTSSGESQRERFTGARTLERLTEFIAEHEVGAQVCYRTFCVDSGQGLFK